jgi:hypothetical protein
MAADAMLAGIPLKSLEADAALILIGQGNGLGYRRRRRRKNNFYRCVFLLVSAFLRVFGS